MFRNLVNLLRHVVHSFFLSTPGHESRKQKEEYVNTDVLRFTVTWKAWANRICLCHTQSISNQLQLDLQRYNNQYPPITIHAFAHAHDRCLIIDGTELYHIGASLKDLGKKWLAFSRMDIEVRRMLEILGRQ